MTKLSVAEAKKQFSDLVGRVLQDGETILIMRRGEAVAKLVPVAEPTAESLSEMKGWLDDDDPFFSVVDEIVESRFQHQPRSIQALRAVHRGQESS
ncbi:MAG TPA: type II toxin-antitoxin system prevent-host-death family antitoxin [Thermoanaerobaculia bacterium]|jgi:prevent-host-death family protein|nr:type II toxin-antitoxin system prevent-host-death family antitoxin [Thermoanaerobaculia bacterium]